MEEKFRIFFAIAKRVMHVVINGSRATLCIGPNSSDSWHFHRSGIVSSSPPIMSNLESESYDKTRHILR